MLNVTVNIRTEGASLDQVRQSVRALVDSTRGEPIKQVAGRAGVNVIQKHLRALDASRANRLGGTRSHYYSAAAAATHYYITPTGVGLAIAHVGVALHYFGGTVRPSGRISAATGRPITRLAIPRRAEAYGRDPAEIPGLFVLRFKMLNRAALVKKESGRLSVYYWLVNSVTHKPDPGVIPTEAAVSTAAFAAVTRYINRQIERTRSGASAPQ